MIAAAATGLHVAWTGHRPDVFAAPALAAAIVAARAAALRERHGPALAFQCGGQRGVDTWAAEAALRLGIALHLVLPLPVAEFAADWPAADRATLDATWAAAATRTVVGASGADPVEAYRVRNRLLAERGALLVAVWTGLGGGGTAETIAFARQLGRPVEQHLLRGSSRAPRPGERGI